MYIHMYVYVRIYIRCSSTEEVEHMYPEEVAHTQKRSHAYVGSRKLIGHTWGGRLD